MYDVFSLPAVRFPEGFLWGSATASHQIEGDNIHSRGLAPGTAAGLCRAGQRGPDARALGPGL